MTLRLLAACTIAATTLAAQLPAPPPGLPARDRAYDRLLDTNVRDGLVYYNAIVLHTVASHYPISGRVADFPRASIRQIPGAFTRKHSVAGRSVSLDELERWLLDTYDDPRIALALGRGSLGGGRLRSEAYFADRLEEQLASNTREFVTRQGHFRIDQPARIVTISPLYSWRDDDFAAGYGDKADPVFKERSPIERAVLALTLEHLFKSEQTWLLENNFSVAFGAFDWRLNDLSGDRVD